MGKFINPFTDIGYKRLAEISDLSSLTREEREHYDSAIRTYRDNIYTMEGEREKGRAEGKAQAMVETAIRMKQQGLPADVIFTVTGLRENQY